MLNLSLRPSTAAQYLDDPLLRWMYDRIREAGPIKSAQVDITHRCNIRCKGCYFFAEEMDQHEAPKDEAVLDAFVEREKARGTNYLTVVGGEPSMMLDQLEKLYDKFWMVVVTNGIRKIPVTPRRRPRLRRHFEVAPADLRPGGGPRRSRKPLLAVPRAQRTGAGGVSVPGADGAPEVGRSAFGPENRP